MSVVNNHLSDTMFTRDDVLMLVSQVRVNLRDDTTRVAVGINDSATATRYRRVCDAIQDLIHTDRLIALDHIRLCTAQARMAQQSLLRDTPPKLAYLETIRRLVSKCGTGRVIDAMLIVDRWTTDQHVPQTMKRMTVQAIMPTLIRDKMVKRGDFHNEYVVL